MKTCTKERLAALSRYAGIYLRHCTVGVYLYWGNLSVYTNSYFRSKRGPDTSTEKQWVISLVILGIAVGSFAVSYTTRFLGKTGSVMLGCLILDSGVFLTYFTVQWSVMAVNLSMGLQGGLGCGFLLCMTFVSVASLEPQNLSLATAVLSTGSNTGAAVINQIITAYINPNDLSPDLFEKNQKYFTQREVLDKVPSVFLILGCFNLCCHGASFILFPPQKQTGNDNQTCAQTGKCEDNLYSEHKHGDTKVGNGELLMSERSKKSQQEREEEIRADWSDENMSLRQVMKCRSFYVLWFSFSCCDYSYVVLNNFYKTYGQTWIPDDRFLTSLGTAQLVTVILTRPLWGMLTDRFGVKLTMVFLNCIISVTSALWYFTPMVSPWAYFLWTMLYMCSNSALYFMFSLSTMKIFGKASFSQNYGLIMSSGIFANLTAPSLMQYLLHSFGWFYLFFSTSCGSALCTILYAVFLPRK